MFKKIAIPVDNSSISDSCIDMGVDLAQRFKSELIGSHVYAASLHYKRFTDLEDGLPEKYKEEKELQRQRDLHDVLIGKGLELISSSYLDVFKEKCEKGSVSFQSKLLEGKNFSEIVKDINSSDCDLVIIGISGLGAVNGNSIGSVCERVARRVNRNLFIVKKPRVIDGKILVAIDGSGTSFNAVKIAAGLAKEYNVHLEIVSAFDPEYHRVAFKGIADVLSAEAGKIFKFSEQEQLHEDIIDNGMAKLYQSHLEEALEMIKDTGVTTTITLLEGKPYCSILEHIKKEEPSVLIVGRTGIHDTGDLDLGSATENLLRLAPCNIIITTNRDSLGDDSRLLNQNPIHRGKGGKPGFITQKTDKEFDSTDLTWDEDAKERVGKIPFFIRGMIIKQIERYTRDKGESKVTCSIVDEVKDNWSGQMDVPH